MSSDSPETRANAWLRVNGPQALESLFEAIVFQPSLLILVVSTKGNVCHASVGIRKFLGLRPDQIVGRNLAEFADPANRGEIVALWKRLERDDEEDGRLRLRGREEEPQELVYAARANVLPERHCLVLRDPQAEGEVSLPDSNPVLLTVPDYALFLLDAKGCVVDWYAGAERVYGYKSEEVLNGNRLCLYPFDDALPNRLADELVRATAAGHFGSESWQMRKDGSRFWANSVILALKSSGGGLEGFAVLVRDFSLRHARDEELRRARARLRPIPAESYIAGIACGEFDTVTEMNETLLYTIGYAYEDIANQQFPWSELTPPEYAALDELAHEECLRFGASTPYEKRLLCKDGSSIPVLVVTAVLNLLPFRWISFVQDLRERDRFERVEDNDAEPKAIFGEIVGSSAALRRVQHQVEVVAPTDATVLILGETGTGKELVARAIHRTSPRAALPFVTLNCAAIPTGLLESELFGYERGAFTGALSQKIGRFEMAHRGTLFLDEVGDIPLDLQPKLLRALQEKSFERLGGVKTIPINVRLVAATNRNLAQMMGDNLFRSDLYYRLKVFPITTPPLRERPEDIPQLVRHFVKLYSAKMGRQIEKIPSDTMRALTSWRWPGNVRELENFIERSVILSSGTTLRAPIAELFSDPGSVGGDSTLEHMEREHIIGILRASNGVVSTAAVRLGIPRTTLNAMMKKLGISRKDL